MTAPEPRSHFTSAAGFRAWLSAHHADAPRLWLVFHKKHTATEQLTYGEALDEALCFGWIDSLVRRIDDDAFARLFTPRRDTARWSAVNLAHARRLIDAGRMTDAGRAKLGVSLDPAKAAPRASRPEALPPELEVDLRRDAAAWEAFQGLPPSCRREYVGWISSAKKPETRARRLDEAKGRLARGERLGLK
jgi:uncharacterized protein YdeI (YjbR/CyaY-like superfamily)